MPDSPGRQLRDTVAEATIQVPGAPNALFARLIEQLGYDAVYLSNAALSAGVLALPDVGLVTLTELVQQATYLTRSVEIPVIVDAGSGFGEAVNVERTVTELECAGVGAVQIADQQSPRRCGQLSANSLVTAGEMCRMLRAAAEVRVDPDLVIIARTDARGVTSLDDAIERAGRYLAAGADWILVEALADADEFSRVAMAVDAPLVANLAEFGASPLLTLEELADIGYAVVLYPETLLRMSMRAAEAALATMADEGTQRELLDLMQTRDELNELLGFQDFEQRDLVYSGDADGDPDDGADA